MILVNSSFKIEDDIFGTEMLEKIELMGRVCYKSEEKITEGSASKFVRDIIKRGHESVLEHEKVTVRVICDRGVSHEIVRHRIASYSQESTRYCDYNNGHLTFIIPAWCTCFIEGEVNPDTMFSYDDLKTPEHIWLSMMASIERAYKSLRSHGWKPEQARSVLPNSLKTEIVMTMNLREWRHFFKLRTANAAHPDMRALARPMLDKFKQLIPYIFEDITYERI